MKLERGKFVEREKLVGFLVIGDGSRDEKVMRALFEVFDHAKIVLMPQSRPALGLEGSVKTTAQLVGRFGRDVLVVIDREHFDEEDFGKYIEEYFEDREVKVDANDFKHVWARRGAMRANFYVAVMGYEKGLEENLATLIHEVYGVRVEPTKEAVWGFLKKKKLHVADLIKKAEEPKLARAFPKRLIELLRKWSEHHLARI